MSLLLSGDLRLAKTYVGTDDPDAAAYIAAVETADGQALETATRVAIHSFVKGCKADGIWPAIKASCILAGARTLDGALVPLVGAAPTNNNFVSGDYNRKTGLVGNGSNKRLVTDFTPEGDHHAGIYVAEWDTGVGFMYGNSNLNAASLTLVKGTSPNASFRVATAITVNTVNYPTAFCGASRKSSTGEGVAVVGAYSQTASNTTFSTGFAAQVFNRSNSSYSDARISFYSFGIFLDINKLNTRVTDLINAFGAAIP